MGSVHDEEPDCCKSKHCCCCFKNGKRNGLEDHFLLNYYPCMKLRKNGTTRMATGAIVGFVLGLIISTGAPQTPIKNILGLRCTDVNGQGYYFSPEDNVGCNSYLYLDDTAVAKVSTVEFRRQFKLCANSNGQHSLAGMNSTCTSSPTLTFNTYTGRETRICYGNPTKSAFNGTAAVVMDDEMCTKYKMAFVEDNTDPAIWQAYVTHLPTGLSAYEGRTYCLYSKGSDLAYPGTALKNAVSMSNCTGSGGVWIDSFQEEQLNSIALMDNFKAQQQDYRDVLYYCFKFPGGLWLNGLKLIVMPLLVANIITSVAQLRETSASGSLKLAWMTALYYLSTTVFAAIESLIVVQMMLIPGMKQISSIVPEVSKTPPNNPYIDSGSQIKSVLNSVIPTNVVYAGYENNFLGIIFFAIVIGTVVGLESKFLKFFSDLNTMMLRCVRVLVLWTPLGVFLLVTYAIAYNDLTHLVTNVALFLGTVLAGLMLHLFVVYPALYFLLTRKNPFILLRNIVPAMIMALSVSSSIATYPITLQCAVLKNKFNRDISKFVLTLGATVNMDGTTIGFPVAVVFVAYAQGYTLSVGQQILIVILSTVSSMGAAPVPQAGLVLLIVIIESLKIPLGAVFSLIIAVDWLYDRPETMVNICGDSFAVGIMDFYLHDQFEKQPKHDLDDHEGVQGASS